MCVGARVCIGGTHSMLMFEAFRGAGTHCMLMFEAFRGVGTQCMLILKPSGGWAPMIGGGDWRKCGAGS